MFENYTLVIAKVRGIFATRLRTPTLARVSDMETPQQPAEARLIDAAQKSAVPKLSMRKASQAAGISDGRWRQIIKGYQGTGTGRIPVVAPGETLARMALVVGVTADQLSEAGRPDAANVLRQLLATSEQADVELETVSTDRLLNEVRRRIERAERYENQDPQGDTPADGETRPSGTPMKGADIAWLDDHRAPDLDDMLDRVTEDAQRSDQATPTNWQDVDPDRLASRQSDPREQGDDTE